ncbi:MAG: hypothetical protein OEM07_03995, partial [Gammaproteobacteria bacterium]|nr:hypothetical protein [Gammaproteobacteria bacterium]
QKERLPLSRKTGLLRYTIVILLCHTCIVQAEEISAFKVTKVDGAVSLKYISDEQEYITQGIVTQKTERQSWQEELSLKMKSYIYHPNFLKMKFGAGFLSDQTTLDSSGNESEANQQVTNLSARLDFLSKQPTPFSVYYNRTNTTVPTGVSGSYLLESARYGTELSVLSPLSPVTIKLYAYRQSNYGTNTDQITDEVSEHVGLSMMYPYGTGAYVKLSHQTNNNISRSGSLALAIVESESSTSSSNIKTSNTFGEARQLKLTTDWGLQKQEEYPERESWFFRPRLNWEHNRKFTSYYTYSTHHTDEQSIETTTNQTTARLNYAGDDSLGGNIGLTHNNSKSSNLESEDKGVNLGIHKQLDASYGKYLFNYSASINIRDQVSPSGLVPVLDDQYTLTSITPVNISRDYIDTTQPIVVTNLTDTQTYFEGTDYIISTIGKQTYIELPIGSNITEGQSILIDYSYQTGGTIKYDRLAQNLNISLALGNYYSFNANFYQSKQDLKEGLPTITLDSSNGAILIFRVDMPIKQRMTVGGEILTQQHNEDSNPYNKQSVSAFTNLPLFDNTSLKLNAGLTKVDNENSNEDINSKTLGLRLHTHLWSRVNMSFDSNYTENTGGSTKRTLLGNNLNFHWHYRQLHYKASVKHQSEEQGMTERNNWSIYMQLTRAF